jgi:PhnB protein
MPPRTPPDGYHTISPYLIVRDVAGLMDFVIRAFEGKEIERMADPSGLVMHGEVRIGDSIVMMGEASGPYPPMPGAMYLYLNDTDRVYARAIKAGAISVMEPADQFYGDRNAGVKDQWGNVWWIATRVEDLSPEELRKRAAERRKG